MFRGPENVYSIDQYIYSEAQCLYVLTDDNYPAISDVKTDASYISCLLSIARQVSTNTDPRTVTLSVLAAGELIQAANVIKILNISLQEHCAISFLYPHRLRSHPSISTRILFYPYYCLLSRQCRSSLLQMQFKSFCTERYDQIVLSKKNS